MARHLTDIISSLISKLGPYTTPAPENAAQTDKNPDFLSNSVVDGKIDSINSNIAAARNQLYYILDNTVL
jgi:hypothetical protein